jgi:phosphoenolpyruvate carboxylase
MDYQSHLGLQQFKNLVGLKFQLYNSLFTSLPFHRIEKTGILLSLLLTHCEEGFKKKQSPQQIIDSFFQKHTTYTAEQEQTDLLFRFVQYTERQVVLFDALEDAAFAQVHDMNGPGTLKQLETDALQQQKESELETKLREFSVRLVLTAHPTQFYPGAVLGIINDLSKALANNNAAQVNVYLQQLGKTPFFKKQKPTPYDEAVSLVWYLENVFYAAAGRMLNFLQRHLKNTAAPEKPLLQMGFWPGGDRDGNPFVTHETTLKVADVLRGSIIKCYYLELRRIRRRLTFDGVENVLAELEHKLYDNIFIPGQRTNLTQTEIISTLEGVRQTLIYQHNGLFLHLVDGLLNKVQLFGLHFAAIDVRQDSAKHTEVLRHLLPGYSNTLTDAEKINILRQVSDAADISLVTDDLAKDTLQTIAAIKTIQQYNGAAGCHRYIISQCSSAVNIAELRALFTLGGWPTGPLPIDLVPLFETIDDLQQAAGIMRLLYGQAWYKAHLQQRGDTQTIMLGFSDGTKDGGYLMANWSIYKAKETLTALSKEYGIAVVFFDGRGGPPARGGGKTHKFYASLGKDISSKEIQLTVQGQTVSSNFGTVDAAQYNMEQLLNAGISNHLFSSKETTLDAAEETLLQQLANESYTAYQNLKNHPGFLQYLAQVSPLQFYAATNIGSRPAKRNAGTQLSLKDLRAIPFVGAWSQLKQNVTGYYGVGTAMQLLDRQGRLGEVKQLYNNSLFFKTLIDNCEMAMQKCFFPLTEHLAQHPQHGELWNIIYSEYELTRKYLFLLSGKNELMSGYPVEQLSVQMRERIVLPLVTIQQYAISKIRQQEEQLVNHPLKAVFEKLVMRCSFGIINAGRNSA